MAERAPRTARTIAVGGILLLLFLHLDFWRPQHGGFVLGWLPVEPGSGCCSCSRPDSTCCSCARLPEGSGKRDVVAARLFGLAISVGVYLLARAGGRSVFDIAALGFAGYVTLTPSLFLGVRWRRFTGAGAIASVLAGNAVLFLGQAGGSRC